MDTLSCTTTRKGKNITRIDIVEFVRATSAAAHAYSGGCVELVSAMSGKLDMPRCPAYMTADARVIQKKSAVRLSASLQHWTNTTTVAAGTAIAWPRVAGDTRGFGKQPEVTLNATSALRALLRPGLQPRAQTACSQGSNACQPRTEEHLGSKQRPTRRQ